MLSIVDACNQAFKGSDKRVFACANNYLPIDQNLVEYAGLTRAIRYLSNQPNTPITPKVYNLLYWMIERLRKINVDGVLYVWPYEARWDSNQQIADQLFDSVRNIRSLFSKAIKTELLMSNAIQGSKIRQYRLGDLLIKYAKMSHSELKNLPKSNCDKISHDMPHVMNKLTHDMPHDMNHDMPHVMNHDMPHVIELNQGVKPEVKLTGGEIYPQDQKDMVDDKASSDSLPLASEEKKITRKRDVLQIWQTIIYKQDDNGKPCHEYIGSSFAPNLYQAIRNGVGYKPALIDVATIGIDIIVAIMRPTKLRRHFLAAKRRDRLEEFWASERISFAAKEICEQYVTKDTPEAKNDVTGQICDPGYLGQDVIKA